MQKPILAPGRRGSETARMTGLRVQARSYAWR
jgi:hypothetical protein